MTWTFWAFLAIATITLFAIVGVRLGLIERRPITYTSKERVAWSIAMAAIPTLGGTYWLVGLVLGIAVYLNGPVYYQYRINRQQAHRIEL